MREIFPRNLSLSDEVKGRCANSMVQIIKFPVPASKFGFKRVKRRAKAAQDPDQLDLFPKTTAQILDFSSALSRFEQALMLDERGDLKAAELRSEERRVGKSVDFGGRGSRKKKNDDQTLIANNI